MGKIKRYCIAAGCKNNDQNSDCTFFAIPSGKTEDYVERCRKWLTLLGREDLLEKKDLKKHHYLVCCAHFDSSSIKLTKTLVKNAIPSLLLSNKPDKKQSSSKAPKSTFKDEKSPSKSTETQTPSSLAKGTLKRKLKDEKHNSKERRLSNEITVIKEEVQEIEIKIEPITCDNADETAGY